MININQRLFELLDSRGITNAEFSRGTDIKTNTISDWRTKGTNPSADKIYRICEYLKISPTYLLTGKEDLSLNLSEDESKLIEAYRLLSDLNKGKIIGKIETYLEDAVSDSKIGEVKSIRYDDFNYKPQACLVHENAVAYQTYSNPAFEFQTEFLGSISAGGGIEAIEDKELIKAPVHCDFALRIKGDSMEPDFKNSSIIYMKKTDAVENGELAAVLVDPEDVLPLAYFKKIYYEPARKSLRLVSLNPKYEDKIIDGQRVKILGKLVYPTEDER